MAHNKNFGRSKHTETYRVVTDKYWPRTPDGTHNARYFDDYKKALMCYSHAVMRQIAEETLMERVSFECIDAELGTYGSMFESFQHHTLASYGIH